MAANVTIKAIDSSTVHQIQSGQVIVDLCSVAKELVENSIDAGATNIEVRFRNQGLDAIEVQDNGSGISAQNYETLALKHYTSKLSSYDDLTTLQTFGFRGEALSSLSALSRLSIVTCTHQEAPRAKRLEFETSGKLKGTSVVSGQKGTTVFVEDLFRALPVRRRELERNIKREWGKVINLLNQYACVQTGIKFTVSQQPTKGKRMVMFSTKGNLTTRDNIINVFGVKTANALIPLDLKLELKATAGPGKKGTAADEESTTEVRVLGHVSRPSHGEGRQTPDRQMFYVNGRPCGLPQFAKVFNEVYRSYNAPQAPFIFADIQLDTHLYDVNVSPDKRTILLHDQGQMLDNLRESLVELFETQDVTIPVAATSAAKLTPFKRAGANRGTPVSAPSSDRGADVASTQSTEAFDEAEEPPASEAEDDLSSDEEPKAREPGRATSVTPIVVSKRSSIRPVATRSVSANVQASSLMSRWLERKADPRGGPSRPALLVREITESSREKGVESGSEVVDDTTPEKPVSPEEDLYGYSGDEREKRTVPATEAPSEEADLLEKEAPILSIPPPSQPPLPRSQIVSPIRLPKRATQEIATIKIGDETVTGIIGSPAPKRFKVADPPVGSGPAPSSKPPTRSMPVPSFGGRLSQLFSAAATQKRSGGDLDVTMEDVEMPVDEEKEDEEEEDEEEEEEEERGEDDDSLFVSQREEVDERAGPENEEAEEDEEDTLESPIVQRTARASRVGSEEKGEPLGSSDDHDSAEAVEPSPSDVEEANGNDDDAYIDEDEKKAKEDKKVQDMIDAAEAKAPELSEGNERRSKMLLKGLSKRKDSVLNLEHQVKVNMGTLRQQVNTWQSHLPQPAPKSTPDETADLESANAEEKLSLKISKSDFANMRIVGQFNLGFILAVRPVSSQAPASDDELFIIDQHASDEKYNFERLQSTTTVQSQRLVQPKTLELTALEEEIVLEHIPSLERNGFQVSVDQSGSHAVGSRVQLLSLPLSRETTFGVSDLEELIFLLGDNPSNSATTVPRPSKVRKMFAMRACRSSIMIGRALSPRQMERVVRHMGEMEKPWNCPHGRPTMRHLCGLGGWDGRGWKEGDVDVEGVDGDLGGYVDWAGWLRGRN
ncbi:hypothetical protein QBC34DRAFT_353737 [Podospora aff. communis PSN243]|uniref:DNA mismatch repair protein PMS1 n=1 Tax=Podospora aff. communis PSN243 TaxID=3040156 RepID=A0AAV9GHZ6_9PEZI|nr:hypothetical protein QBC34DRAFT_353737 [Podospora aff. communis PSN243]